MVRMIQAYDRYSVRQRLLFIAGPTTGEDWQSEFYKLLIHNKIPMGWDVMNPKPEKKSSDLRKDIKWQYEALIYSNVIAFWFPKDADPTFAMFDLGRWTSYEKPLCVGVEKGFAHEKFIIQNLSYTNKDIVVTHSLEDLAKDAVAEATKYVVE